MGALRPRNIVIGCLSVLLMLAVTGTADTIQLPDRQFKGDITEGFPSSISIEIKHATATVTRDKILSIDFGSPTTIATITGHTFEGSLTSTPSEVVTINTDAGAVEVPLAKIRSLSFPRDKVQPPQFCQVVSLNNNEQYNGNIKEGMPDPLQFKDQSGATAQLNLNKIREIQYTSPAVAQTQEGTTYRGEIVSRIPNTLLLETAYGSLEIDQSAITGIRFLKPQECQDGNNNGVPWWLYALGGVLSIGLLLAILR